MLWTMTAHYEKNGRGLTRYRPFRTWLPWRWWAIMRAKAIAYHRVDLPEPFFVTVRAHFYM